MAFPLYNSMGGPQTGAPSAFSLSSQPGNAWSGVRTDYPRDKTISQLFEEMATIFPQKTALISGSTQLTYSELNARANCLARELRRLGVAQEQMVACYLGRSIELIVAFLAILKAGGAYVPLDICYPRERLDLMLGEICAPVILTQRSVADTITRGDQPTLFVDEITAGPENPYTGNLDTAGTANTLAYVMYTSGSTGQPKGVMIENRSVVRLVRGTNFCDFGPEEVFLQSAPPCFDASTLEIWGPLLNGGQLVLMPAGIASLEDLGQAISEHDVTTLWLTSGLFNLMVEQRLDDLRPIRQLLAGGDVLSARHVRKVLDSIPGIRLINGYGPTENTTFTCCHVMCAGDLVPESVPIGRPISNTRVYILDANLCPVPLGASGELFAAGDGVARGYLNDHDRTAEKFLPDPFSQEPNAHMYRTGDLARWRDDGLIEFLGRLDDQVKILGHRIEPCEIELALRAHREVNQVCVVPQTDESGSKRLVAYFTSSGNTGISGQELKRFLAGRVPSYMVPAIFVQVASFPLSPNGKIERAALPAPVFGSDVCLSANAASNQIEEQISEIWKRILRVAHVGLDDNFFDLGGDSLLLIAVQSNLQKVLHLEIPVTDLFEFTTIRALASRLGKPQGTEPAFAEVHQQAQKQRDAFARARERRNGDGT